MKNNEYYTYSKAENFLNSAALTEPTRKALLERMVKGRAIYSNKFFAPYHFNLLSLICDRLMDQDPEDRIVNIALFIDERLANNTCDGWRYNNMPPDEKMLIRGLEGIYETSIEMYDKIFIALKKEAQIKVLETIQQGNPPGNTWKTLSAKRFFEELLAEASEIFFSHPLVQLQMGYVRMADAGGWAQIGLNES